MTLFTVDANILVYAANESGAHWEAAKALVERLRIAEDPWCVAWPTLYEFARVVTHPKVLSRPWRFDQAWRYLEGLLESPSVRLIAETPLHHATAREVASAVKSAISGNLVHDLHLAVLMKEHGVSTIYTQDSAFSVFPHLRVIMPFK